MSGLVRYHTDLDVWQLSKSLAVTTYGIVASLPASERFGLADQIKRSAASIPANIAEGCGRGTTRELIRFLRIARGSLSELHSHLSLAADLGYLALDGELSEKVSRVHSMLNSLIGSLKRSRK
jgi:four helix bundle protein